MAVSYWLDSSLCAGGALAGKVPRVPGGRPRAWEDGGGGALVKPLLAGALPVASMGGSGSPGRRPDWE